MGGEVTQKEVNQGIRVLESDALGEEARRWFVRYTDPFHDQQLEPAGYPDADQSASVIQEVNMSFNATVPASVTSGQNWDLMVFNWADVANTLPVAIAGGTTATLNPSTGLLAPASGGGTAIGPMAGIGVYGAPAGQKFMPENGSSAIGSGVTNLTNINPAIYVGAKSRVVGMAIEAINTTAELSLQGTCTAFRMPQINDTMWINTTLTGTSGAVIPNMLTFRAHALPPSNVQEALILPASRQWDAKEGYYGVCTLQGVENPFRRFDNQGRIYLESSLAQVNPVSAAATNIVSCIVSPYGASVTPIGGLTYPLLAAPFNMSGFFMTGLSYVSTIQINVKFLIEANPGPRSVLATLARPSPPYSPMALELASRVMSELPVGVPFSRNPSGEWMSEVLGALGDLAGMASVIHPGFAVAGAGLKLAKNVIPGLLGSKSNKSKKKAKPQEEDAKPLSLAKRKALASSKGLLKTKFSQTNKSSATSRNVVGRPRR